MHTNGLFVVWVQSVKHYTAPVAFGWQVIARPKGLSPKINRSSHNSKSNKLPPRLAKQKEQREKEKEMNKNIMANIEQWDNEMAISIPFQPGSGIDDKGTGT